MKKHLDFQYYDGLTLPTVRYQYPENGINPFDLNNEGAFFIIASGESLLSSDVEFFKEPYKNSLVVKNIPMGYKNVSVFYRVLVVRDGIVYREFSEDYEKVLKINPHFEKESLSKGSNTGRYFIIQSSESAYIEGINTDYTVARKRTIELSKDNPNNAFIVARELINVYWH
ncbi:hypothetical protein [Ureibacillus acetophenoni]|uniref:Uncharacterized protein n=1 Tax=Ureibacillus acetophenoni TaxID=614649 RepID=A0A285UPZ7_9BACL|nr:hypothetical protein [Ureibacillus acetophenoni]SOC43823.1 hypothetical protein SAMN05877842_11759 [Ureibacillus acetophenoni]